MHMMIDSQRPDILVVGSVAFDSIETPRESARRVLGGSAVFASVAASYFARPRIVAVVGDDFVDEHRDLLGKHGVDVTGVQRVEGGRTFEWKGRYHENMKERDTLETNLNVFAEFDPVLSPSHRQSPYVFLGNIGPELQARVLDQVGAPRLVGMDTMNLWIRESLADLKKVLRRIDVLFLNDEESSQLTGETQVLNAARATLALGPKYVVVKRGEYGALLFGEDLCLFVPAVLLPDVVDPTGAGDAFAGGFMGSLAGAAEVTSSTLARALRVGTAMASFACQAFSVDALADLEPSEIERRIASLESMCA